MADLASLQSDLKAAKEKWEELKLGKAKKEAATFPFPVPSSELPPQLQSKSLGQHHLGRLVDAQKVLSTWKKHLKKKAAPWGIAPTFEWVATNFAKLLMLDAECSILLLVGFLKALQSLREEGCDENDCSMRRYAIGPPAAAPEEETESEEDSDEEEDAETEAGRPGSLPGNIYKILIGFPPRNSGISLPSTHRAMEANHDYALWQTLGHWTVYVEWFVALVVAAAVASAWRGAWLVLDAELWPQRPTASAALGLGWGVVLFGILGFAQPCLASAVGRARHKQIFWLVDAIYSYLGFWCCVLIWRGVWQLWDGALGFAPVSNEDLAPGFVRGAWLSHCVGVSLLLAAGAMRSLNAPPTLILAELGMRKSWLFCWIWDMNIEYFS
eukprot:s449_g44.t1